MDEQWTRYNNQIAYTFEVVYYLSTTDQTVVINIMSEVVVRAGQGWIHSTGTYTTGSSGLTANFNVRLINPASVSYARTFNVDAISFTGA